MLYEYCKDCVCYNCHVKAKCRRKCEDKDNYNIEPKCESKCKEKCNLEKKYKSEYKDNKISCKPKLSGIVALEAVATTPQTVLSGLAVPFNANLVAEGYGILHSPGSSEFIIIKPELYKVTFTSSVNTFDSPIAGVALAINGIIIPGTTVTVTSINNGVVNLTTEAIIRVIPPVNTILTVVNITTGTEIFTNPNIIIERVEE